MLNLGDALWTNREHLFAINPRLERLRAAVDWPGDLTLGQWLQLTALVMQFEPDLIIELGRGYGNSTCVFTEAANKLEETRVVSIGYDYGHGFAARTVPRLREIVEENWFDPLTILHQDIREVSFPALLEGARRVFLFWDAHGGDLARFLLAKALPSIAETENLIGVHDIADARFDNPERAYIRSDGEPSHWLGSLVSPFPEFLFIYDFLSRNHVEYASASGAVNNWLTEQVSEVQEDVLATFEKHFASDTPLNAGHWIYFQLPKKESIVFPSYPEDAPRYEDDDLLRDSPARLGVRPLLGKIKHKVLKTAKGLMPPSSPTEGTEQ